MIHHTRFLLSVIALGGICFGAAGAQVPPPSATPAAQTEPAPAASTVPATTAPQTAAPATEAPSPTAAPARHIKKLKEATLPFGQVKFALTHPLQEAKKLRAMHTVKFENIRVVRLSKLNIKGLKAMNVDLLVARNAFGTPAQVAAITLPSTNGSNSPIQYLQDVLANINVSNALNDVLNNSTLNLNVSLSDVLNNNKIAIGQVVGVYVGGGGLINTIVK